eukprot:CAMPEP_0195294720 /NCGR_PEP_ID=MMETSP0707-20130614/15756_1 /TAXON_ID=33640 /ORGANISM="Asterionellopsis glacialis, Strain CCMP134" /LENGTH=545 /DNA_ID=CAMNT_0040355767 /DNA_START=155 /DNA_END=1792 /DNA_ORIENTATION=+
MPVITGSDALLLDVAMKEDGDLDKNNNSRHKRAIHNALHRKRKSGLTSSTRSSTSDLTASDHEGDSDDDEDCSSDLSTASISSLSNLFAEIENKVSTSAGLVSVARGGSSSHVNHNDRDRLKRDLLKLQTENRQLKKGYEQMRGLCVELMEENTRLKRKNVDAQIGGGTASAAMHTIQFGKSNDAKNNGSDETLSRTSESIFDPAMRIGEITIPKADAASKYLGSDAATQNMKRSTSVPTNVGYHNILTNYKSIVGNNNNKANANEKDHISENIKEDKEKEIEKVKESNTNKRRIDQRSESKKVETSKANSNTESEKNEIIIKSNEQGQEGKIQVTRGPGPHQQQQQHPGKKVYHTMRRASFISECSSNFTDLHFNDSSRTLQASDYVSADGETIPIHSDCGESITTDDDVSHNNRNHRGAISMNWWNRTRRLSVGVSAQNDNATSNDEPGLEGTDSSSTMENEASAGASAANQEDDDDDDIKYEIEGDDDHSDIDAENLKSRLLSLICEDSDDDMPEVLDVGRHQHCARILQSQIYQEASFGYL